MSVPTPKHAHRRTARTILAAGIVAALAMALAACGSDDRSDAAADSTPAPTTRVVQTAKGEVTVPADPQRIVALAPQVRGTLYDLGVDPVGIYNEGDEYISPRYRDKIAGAAVIGGAGELDLEKIAAAKPDLIIGVDYEWNTKDYSQLSQIAPTVIVDGTTWQGAAQATADAVGKDDELAALDKQFDERAAAIKSQYADVLAKYRWDIVQGGFDDGKFWLYGPKSDVGAILSDAGVQFASASAGVTGPENKAISYENLDTLTSADAIGFYANYDNTPTNNGPQLFKQEGFQSLPAVKAGHTVPIPDFLPAGYGDALAVLDQLEAGLKTLGSNG